MLHATMIAVLTALGVVDPENALTLSSSLCASLGQLFKDNKAEDENGNEYMILNARRLIFIKRTRPEAGLAVILGPSLSFRKTWDKGAKGNVIEITSRSVTCWSTSKSGNAYQAQVVLGMIQYKDGLDLSDYWVIELPAPLPDEMFQGERREVLDYEKLR